LVVLLFRKAHRQYRGIPAIRAALGSHTGSWCRVTVGFGLRRFGGEGPFDAHCSSLRTQVVTFIRGFSRDLGEFGASGPARARIR
jgi:hypothetical protein